MISGAEEFIEESKNGISADRKSIEAMLEKADSLYHEAQIEIENRIKEIPAKKAPAKKRAPAKRNPSRLLNLKI